MTLSFGSLRRFAGLEQADFQIYGAAGLIAIHTDAAIGNPHDQPAVYHPLQIKPVG
jgi:hypothetical protein